MIRFTKHAQEAVEKRGIAREWIDRTIAAPDFTRADPNDRTLTHSFKVIDEAGRRILRVVHRPEQTDMLIVTAHFDRNAKP